MAETSQTPERVQIFDTTLRDGAQSPGISLSQEESLTIARQLSRLGVDVIEAGFPVSSEANFESVQAIAREVEGPVIAGLARAQAGDIARAGEAVRDADMPRIHTFLSTSDIHMASRNTDRDETKEQARIAVAHAKQLVEDVQFSPMDASRSDIEFTAEVIDIAIAEGATVINVPDTVGFATPEDYAKQLERLYELVPALGGVTLSVHCHDDLGLAVANSFAGVKAGARQVEAAINGLGERAGNTSLEEFVMLLAVRGEEYGLETGIDTRAIGPTSRMVADYTGYRVPRNKAIVGANAFKHESGIHQKGILTDRKTFEIMSPESVGMETDGIALGKQSGRGAVEHVLQDEGVFRPDYMVPTFKLFKEIADEIGEITREQMVAIHEEAKRLADSEFTLLSFEAYKDSAMIELEDSSNNKLYGSVVKRDLFGGEADEKIDGTTSALFSAIRKATNTEYTLETFRTEAIGRGENALALAHVELRINGKTVSSKGLSTDTSEAAAKAYLSALTKAMRSGEQDHSEAIVQV